MNPSHSPAKLGEWTDYTTGETWYVTTTPTGYILSALVGIWLSFAAKHLKQILANLALYIHNGCYKTLFSCSSTPEEAPLLGGQRPPTPTANDEQSETASKELAKIFKASPGFRDLVHEFFFNKTLRGKWWFGKHRRGLLWFFLSTSTITVAFIVGGLYVVRIKATGPVMLDSPKCGLWTYNRDRGGDEAATRAGIHDLEKEERAGAYAQNCYGKGDVFDAVQCNFLYKKELTFGAADYTSDCPFENSICRQNQTVTFVTGLTYASELGINSRHSPSFRRHTSCTPLSMDYPFIQNVTTNGTTSYYYYYGERPLHSPPVNYTYTTTGDPFDNLVPAYDVFTYTTNNTNTKDRYWKPRWELEPPEFTTLTLIFISSGRILYKKASEDPLFPSDEKYFLPGEEKPWFRNSDARARPLACLNYIEVCLGDGTCWPMDGPMAKDEAGNPVLAPSDFWLMYTSLLKTDIYNSIEKRLGRALIAQKMVSQYFSEGLSDFHWVDEVQNLVRTSHARTQINAWSVASGEDSIHEGKDGYTWRTRNEMIYGTLCGLLKYNPPGYTSFRYAPSWFVLCFFPGLAILSVKWSSITDVSGREKATESDQSVTQARDLDAERAQGDQASSELAAQDVQATGGRIRRKAESIGSKLSQAESSRNVSTVADAPGPSTAHPLQTAVRDGSEGSEQGSLSSVDIGSTTGPDREIRAASQKRLQTPQPVATPAALVPATGLDETEWEPLLIGKLLEIILLILPVFIFLLLPLFLWRVLKNPRTIVEHCRWLWGRVLGLW